MSESAQRRPIHGDPVLPPRPVLALAILLVGGLGWSLASAPPPLAALADAARWEGQSVTLEGWATEVRQGPDGARFVLVDGSHAVPVRVPAADGASASASAAAALPVAAGDRVQAAGRLSRWQGELRLDVEDPGDVRAVPGGALASPSLAEVAGDPASWQGRPVLVRGLVAEGRLADGPRSVALGDGPWPHEGPVQARGLLRWDPACLCHRLDAREVWPWTP